MLTLKHQLDWKTVPSQDGAIYGGKLFRFNADGKCRVYDVNDGTLLSEFTLSSVDVICPHANAVCFGAEKYDENDEYPLLYSNMYNNAAAKEDRLEGVCCVYRLTCTDGEYNAALVQLIRIGFTEDLSLWKSLEGKGDVRPYGNFVVDADAREYWGFTMRDADRVTRFFGFDLPKLGDGEYDEKYGVKVVTLDRSDIKSQFDTEYSNYVQGAIMRGGIIYSVEGFNNAPNLPRMRVIDTRKKEQIQVVELHEMGMPIEPELVDFVGDDLLYSDARGLIWIFEDVK